MSKINLLQALALGYFPAHLLEGMVSAYRKGALFVTKGFEEFVGVPESVYDGLSPDEFNVRWDCLLEFGRALLPEPVSQELLSAA
jgi:hypothetical protein